MEPVIKWKAFPRLGLIMNLLNCHHFQLRNYLTLVMLYSFWEHKIYHSPLKTSAWRFKKIYICPFLALRNWNNNDSFSLQWRHNDYDSVSNHQLHGCLLDRLFKPRSKKTPKLRVTGLCVGNSPGPVNSPHKGPVTRKMFPFDDVIMYIMEENVALILIVGDMVTLIWLQLPICGIIVIFEIVHYRLYSYILKQSGFIVNIFVLIWYLTRLPVILINFPLCAV